MPRDAHAREPDPIGALSPDRFQRREWAALRVARWALIAGLVAAGLGAFGGGPLSSGRASSGPLRVTHERVSRVGTAAVLEVRVDPAPEGRLTLEVGDYLDGAEVVAITPAPTAQRRSGRLWLFEFDTRPGEPAVVEFRLRFDRPGTRPGAVGVAGERVAFRAMVLP